MRILVINGPNLNMLGYRQVEIYGTEDYQQLVRSIQADADAFGLDVEIRQSNHEGTLIDWLHQAEDAGFHGVVLNAGALTHYSYSLYDAVLSISLPVIEVHLTDLKTREESFRSHSVIRPACHKHFEGDGIGSYRQALAALKNCLRA